MSKKSANELPISPKRSLFLKRIFDTIGAGGGLMITFPLLGAIAIIIRWQMGSPIFFRQTRPGLHGKPFTIYKFRTMRGLKDHRGNLLPDNERATKFGQLLRRTSLDELPELWNVLKGKMSLVGPRPLLMEYLPLYSPEQYRRYDVKPGITGWAQINGRNAISWEKKFRLDVWYVDHQSFWLDLKILWLTLLKVIRSEDIGPEDSATMPFFTGTKKEEEDF